MDLSDTPLQNRWRSHGLQLIMSAWSALQYVAFSRHITDKDVPLMEQKWFYEMEIKDVKDKCVGWIWGMWKMMPLSMQGCHQVEGLWLHWFP